MRLHSMFGSTAGSRVSQNCMHMKGNLALLSWMRIQQPCWVLGNL